MEKPIMDYEASDILRRHDRKRKAKEILAGPSEPMWIGLGFSIVASVLAQYVFKKLAAPDIVFAVMVGMFVGFVVMAFQLWALRRRLDAAIELINLNDCEEPLASNKR